MFQIYDESESIYSKSESYTEDISWITWYCDLQGHEYFVQVDTDFIRDDFNLAGFSSLVYNFNRALDTILDELDEDEDDDDEDENYECKRDPYLDAERLYKLIHARYILTNKGLSAMLEKYNAYTFGTCPKIYCQNQAVIPTGISDVVNVSVAKVICPRCNEIYYPNNLLCNIDGAAFGTSFAQAFALHYSDLIVPRPIKYYSPEIYGFKVWRGLRDYLQKKELGPDAYKKFKENNEYAYTVLPIPRS